MTSAPAASSYDAEREVRFAIVLYGGVSLAIYMNGIIHELFAMVRATAPRLGGPGLHVDTNTLRGAEAVYRDLASYVPGADTVPNDTVPNDTVPNDTVPNDTVPNDGVVRTRFVIDILTGTSAGGINGVVLAKALANDQSIDRLAQLWIDEGDIAKLLNDKQAVADIRGLAPEKPPASFLSGQRMLYRLLEAIDGVSASNTEPPPSPYADQIDLWVTATDLDGRDELVPTSDQARLGTVRETDHHVRFHFVYDNAPGVTDPINMFEREFDPALAFAARATSSFPGAFRAVQWSDLGEVEDAYVSEAGERDWLGVESDPIRRLFQRYETTKAITETSFADGGYLDNQPVDLVMQTLPKRRADLPVSRRVLFIDPNPGDDTPPTPTKNVTPRADLLSTLLKVVTLPRVQTIGGEIDRIEALAPPLAVRSEIYKAVEASLDPSAPVRPFPGAGYLMLRVADTLDDLAAMLARIGFPDRAYDADSPQYRTARTLLARGTPAGRADSPTAQLQLAIGLDLGYEMRRISFVQHRVAGEIRALAADDPKRVTLQAYRSQLATIEQRIIERGRALRSRAILSAPGSAAFAQSVVALQPRLALLATTGVPAQPAAADVALLATMLAALTTELGLDGARSAIDNLTTALGDPLPTLWWTCYQQYDEATLALSELLPGENDDIKVVRVSPRDATSIYTPTPNAPKLAGTAVHHFGGFFSAQWRRNDIMWGRLDAAERLINLVLEDAPAAARATYIRRAQLGIIGDLLIDPTDGQPNADYYELFRVIAPGCDVDGNGNPTTALDPERVLAKLHDYRPPPGPTRETILELATRAAQVTDAVAAGIGQATGPLKTVRTWIGAILRPAAQLGELVLDHSIASALTRRLLDLAVYASILMIVVGAFLGGKPVVTFGWTVLAIALGAKVAINITRDWVRGQRLWWWPVAALVAVMAAVAVEGLLLYGGPTRWVGLFVLGAATGFVVIALGSAGAKLPSAALITAAIVVLTAAAGFGVFQIADNGKSRICTQSDWEKSLVNALPRVECPPVPVSPPKQSQIDPAHR